MDVTTPLAGTPYPRQVASKEEEVDILLKELQQEIIEYRSVVAKIINMSQHCLAILRKDTLFVCMHL